MCASGTFRDRHPPWTHGAAARPVCLPPLAPSRLHRRIPGGALVGIGRGRSTQRPNRLTNWSWACWPTPARSSCDCSQPTDRNDGGGPPGFVLEDRRAHWVPSRVSSFVGSDGMADGYHAETATLVTAIRHRLPLSGGELALLRRFRLRGRGGARLDARRVSGSPPLPSPPSARRPAGDAIETVTQARRASSVAPGRAAPQG